MLHDGNFNIISALTQLPATKHETTRPEKICVDAWQIMGLLNPAQGMQSGTVQASADTSSGAMLFVSLHGEFVESNPLFVTIHPSSHY
jgi:hypothetical protein